MKGLSGRKGVVLGVYYVLDIIKKLLLPGKAVKKGLVSAAARYVPGSAYLYLCLCAVCPGQHIYKEQDTPFGVHGMAEPVYLDRNTSRGSKGKPQRGF